MIPTLNWQQRETRNSETVTHLSSSTRRSKVFGRKLKIWRTNHFLWFFIVDTPAQHIFFAHIFWTRGSSSYCALCFERRCEIRPGTPFFSSHLTFALQPSRRRGTTLRRRVYPKNAFAPPRCGLSSVAPCVTLSLKLGRDFLLEKPTAKTHVTEPQVEFFNETKKKFDHKRWGYTTARFECEFATSYHDIFSQTEISPIIGTVIPHSTSAIQTGICFQPTVR